MTNVKPKNSKIRGKFLVVAITLQQTVDESEMNLLRESLRGVIDRAETNGLVIDLQNLKLLPSEILAIFVELHRAAPNRIKLCNVHPNIQETLKRTQLIRLFDVFTDENAAVASLSESSVRV